MKFPSHSPIYASILAALLLNAPGVLAQVPDAAKKDDAQVLDEITVSARGVDEPLQAMPLPITAVSKRCSSAKA